MNFETQLEQFKLKDYQLNQLRTYAQFLNEKNIKELLLKYVNRNS